MVHSRGFGHVNSTSNGSLCVEQAEERPERHTGSPGTRCRTRMQDIMYLDFPSLVQRWRTFGCHLLLSVANTSLSCSSTLPVLNLCQYFCKCSPKTPPDLVSHPSLLFSTVPYGLFRFTLVVFTLLFVSPNLSPIHYPEVPNPNSFLSVSYHKPYTHFPIFLSSLMPMTASHILIATRVLSRLLLGLTSSQVFLQLLNSAVK